MPREGFVLQDNVAVAREQLVCMFALPMDYNCSPAYARAHAQDRIGMLQIYCAGDFEDYHVLRRDLLHLCGLSKALASASRASNLDEVYVQGDFASFRADLLAELLSMLQNRSVDTGDHELLRRGIKRSALLRFMLIKHYYHVLSGKYTFGQIGIGQHATGTVSIQDAAWNVALGRGKAVGLAAMDDAERTTIKVLGGLFVL